VSPVRYLLFGAIYFFTRTTNNKRQAMAAMLTPDQENYILTHAYIPEHTVGLMTSLSRILL